MKKLITILSVVFIATTVLAQVPQKMSYQAVIRNSSGVLITNQSVGMRVSISTDSTFTLGNINYREIYNPNPITNTNGLVTVEIGTGLPAIGTFAGINWANSPFYIKTEIDPSGSTNYTINGKSELISVPYALYAGNANYVGGNGISVAGNTITNTKPDQTVAITGTGSATVTGTYPSFNVDANVSAAMPKYITNVQIVNLYNVNGFAPNTFMPVDISQYVPVGATHAILYVNAITTYSVGYWVDFKKDLNSQSIYTCGTTLGTAQLPVNELQLIVPISSQRQFLYFLGCLSCIGSGTTSTASLIITLVGYY